MNDKRLQEVVYAFKGQIVYKYSDFVLI